MKKAFTTLLTKSNQVILNLDNNDVYVVCNMCRRTVF